MRAHRPRALTWIVFAAVLAGCGGAGGGGGGGAATHTPQELGAALLTAADAGTGWTEQERQVATSTTTPATPSTGPGATGSQFCPAASKTTAELDQVMNQNQAMVVLASPDATADRPVGVQEQLWSVDHAATLFSKAKDAVSACMGKTWTVTSGEEVTLGTIQGLPKIGDESISVLASATEPTHTGKVEWWVPMTMARFGDVFAMLTGTDIHDVGTQPSLTTEELSNIFTTAATKIEGLES